VNVSRVDRVEREASARRYVAGRMSEAEESDFETRLLEDPQMVQEVETTRRMREGLQHLQRIGELDRGTPARTAWWARAPLAAAASVVIVLAAATVYYFRPAEPSTILYASAESSATGSSPPSYVLAETRSENQGVAIPMPEPRGIIRLNVLTAHPDVAGPRQLELKRADTPANSEPLARIEAGPADQGLVAVFVNTEQLAAGPYVLTVIEPQTTGQSPATSRYAFTLTASK
jgi:hypothetical protein